MRLPETRLHSSPLDEAVTFQADQVCAHGVVGEIQRGCEIIHRTRRGAEQREDLTSRAVKQPLPKWLAFHTMQFNKTKKANNPLVYYRTSILKRVSVT